MQRLRFFMDLSGNKDLLDRELVAFFASRKATPHDTQLALQWAESICQTDKVVISGFHSPLEKEVLNYLLERHHPVILHSAERFIRRCRRTCKRLLTREICYLFRFVTTRAIAGTPPNNAIGAPPASPTRSISPNSTTPAPSAPCTLRLTGIAIRSCMF